MSTQKGYYSLMQFCPNPARLEAVNVGVVLFCPESKFLASEITESNERVRRVFAKDEINLAVVDSAKRGLQKRLEVEQFAIRDLADLQKFVETRANAVTLSPLRPMKVSDPQADLRKLFDELVGGSPKPQHQKSLIPELDSMFARLMQQGRAEHNREVVVPIMGRPFRSPYAYQNGVLNLVKPQRFTGDEDSALKLAGSLAIKGSLFLRHSDDTRLVVVSTFATPEAERSLEDRVVGLLRDFDVKAVRRCEVPEFLALVEAEAH